MAVNYISRGIHVDVLIPLRAPPITHRMRSYVSLLGIVLCSIVACTEPANPPNFPQVGGNPDGLDALLVGELVSDNGCLRLRKLDEGIDHLIIWRQTADMTADGQSVRITDESGVSSSFSVGEELRMGGAETKNLDKFQESLVQPIPDNCPGPYWLYATDVAAYRE